VFVLAGFVVIGAGIKLAAPVLVPFVLGGFIAIVVSPVVSWAQGLGCPRWLAIALAMLAATAAVAILGTLVGSSAGELTARLPAYATLAKDAAHDVAEWLKQYRPGLTLPELVDPGAAVGVVTGLLGDVAGFLSSVLLAVIIAGFLLLDQVRGSGHGGETERPKSVRRALQAVNRYMAIKTVTSIATGVLVGLWTWMWGADLPLMFGLLAFVLNYIPNIGSIVAALPAIALALMQDGLGPATGIASGYLLVNIGIGGIMEPRLMGRGLGLSPHIVILSVIVWGWLLGTVGALLSALLTVMLKLALSSLPDLRPLAGLLGPLPSRPREPEKPPEEEEEEALVEAVVPQVNVRTKPGKLKN